LQNIAIKPVKVSICCINCYVDVSKIAKRVAKILKPIAHNYLHLICYKRFSLYVPSPIHVPLFICGNQKKRDNCNRQLCEKLVYEYARAINEKHGSMFTVFISPLTINGHLGESDAESKCCVVRIGSTSTLARCISHELYQLVTGEKTHCDNETCLFYEKAMKNKFCEHHRVKLRSAISVLAKEPEASKTAQIERCVH